MKISGGWWCVSRRDEVREKRRKRRLGLCRFAANPKISMLAGMLKPGISFGRLPEERYSVGGHARPEATGLVASNVRPLGLLAKKGEGRGEGSRKKKVRRKNNEKTHRLCRLLLPRVPWNNVQKSCFQQNESGHKTDSWLIALNYPSVTFNHSLTFFFFNWTSLINRV